MSRYDLRWAWRHPAGWARIMWLPLSLSATIGAMAFTVRNPVFDVVPGSPLWPLIFAWVSAALLFAAIAPLDRRVQAAAAGGLFTVASLRAVSYAWAWLFGEIGSDARDVVVVLALHWIAWTVISVWLPVLVEHAGRVLTVEAGTDDRGGR